METEAVLGEGYAYLDEEDPLQFWVEHRDMYLALPSVAADILYMYVFLVLLLQFSVFFQQLDMPLVVNGTGFDTRILSVRSTYIVRNNKDYLYC